MKGLIVAGVAGLAGVAGVAGLSAAATGGGQGGPGGSAPALTTTSTATAPSLHDRIAEVRRAERAADRALARTAPRPAGDAGAFARGPGGPAPAAAVVLVDDHARAG